MTKIRGERNFRTIASVVLFVFAFFGFLESVFAISSALSDDKARLEARAYASKPLLPYYFYASLGKDFDENERTFIDALSKACQKEGSSDELPTKNLKKHYCEHVDELEFLSNQIEETYTFSGTVFQVELENTGQTTAKAIKISSGAVVFLDAYFRGARLKSTYDADQRVYNLPDLNPGETIQLEIWKRGRPYTNSEFYDFELPTITFDGPKIEIAPYEYVRSSRWNVVEPFFDAGPVFGIVFFSVVGFFITVFVIVFIVVAIGLLRGMNLKQIFVAEAYEEWKRQQESGSNADHSTPQLGDVG